MSVISFCLFAGREVQNRNPWYIQCHRKWKRERRGI